MLSPLAFALAVFAIGLLFGSFLNVCISRLPEHKSIAKPRSCCPHCKTTIRWYDNIPLLSWILLRAKCRHCGASISWRYPLVEFAVGLWFVVCWSHYAMYGFNHFYFPGSGSPDETTSIILTISVAILGFLLIGLLVMDWQTQKLPDAFTLPGIVIGFLLVCTQAIFLPTGADDVHLTPRNNMRMRSPGSFAARGNVFLTGTEHLVFGRLTAIVGAALILILIRALYKAIRHGEGLGLGDVKLIAMIAAFLGFWPAVLSLFLGTIVCSFYALTLLARRRADLATQLPLGTFLCIGGLISALFGDPIIAWYRSLL